MKNDVLVTISFSNLSNQPAKTESPNQSNSDESTVIVDNSDLTDQIKALLCSHYQAKDNADAMEWFSIVISMLNNFKGQTFLSSKYLISTLHGNRAAALLMLGAYEITVSVLRWQLSMQKMIISCI